MTAEPVKSDEADCELCGPPIELARGGCLSLRHTSAEDVAGLQDLYEQLEIGDLRRRFFTAGPPSTKFLEHWASLQQEGGFGLVVEVAENGATHLVGEAGYGRYESNGQGCELGITIAPRSRGWIGPWLLDRLLAHADQRDVANLQAVVMIDNRAMMRLAAKRGYAILGHPDRGLIRIAISTSGSVPSWTGSHDRPRVLVESDRTRWFGEEALLAAEFDIAICAETCRGGKPCPVMEGESCPLIEGADAVIVDLQNDRHASQLLAQEHIVHPGVRQIVVDHSERPTSDSRSRLDNLVELIRAQLSETSTDGDLKFPEID